MEAIGTAVGVISLLCSCSNGCKDLCNTFKVKKHKEAMESAMEELKEARDDVQRRVEREESDPNEPVKRTSQVNGWLQRVQTVENEIGNMLLKADLQITKCFGCGCPINCWTAYKHGKMMIQMLELVKDLNNKASFAALTDKLPTPCVQEIPVGSTVGMESMLDKAWRLLMGSEGDACTIMGLYGPGGVGKTALLKQINNEFLKLQPQVFDVVIFVVVSKAINIEEIQKEIGKRLSLPSPNKASIYNVLKKMKFVLLLDDLWERVDLQGDIGVPPLDNNSKVIFTTRSEIVCGVMEASKKMKVDCLPWNQAWSLFLEKVGEDALKSHPKIPELAEIVAKECGGLPLVLITIGRAMSTKKTPEQWNHAITILRKSPHKFPGMGDKVLPLLMLSYDNLHDDTIKSCFLYCSLFPEDFSIYIEKLVELWVGEGFFSESNNIDEAFDQGYEVVGSLKDACLLECGDYIKDHQVKMHDVIRDLALWITTGYGRKADKFLVVGQVGVGTSYNCGRWKNAERIYLRETYSLGDSEEVPKFPNLLTLISWDVYATLGAQTSINMILSFTPLLRVLDLSGFLELPEFPSSITELVELQFLRLTGSHFKELPDEMRKLVKLKRLDLSYTQHLEKIPCGVIGSLVELEVLDMTGSSFGDWDDEYESSVLEFSVQDAENGRHRHMALQASIAEVGTLKHLNHLIGITVTNAVSLEILLSSTTTTPQMFQSCTKVPAVHIKEMRHVKTLALSSLYRRFKNLIRTLTFHGCVSLEELRLMDENMLPQQLMVQGDGRQANHELHLNYLTRLRRVVLVLKDDENYTSTTTVTALCSSYSSSYSFLHSLTIIYIYNCPVLKDLTWLVYVMNLEYLTLGHCKGIEEIIVDDDDDDEGVDKKLINNFSNFFGRLRVLRLDELSRLKSICRHPLALPSLETVWISNCPKLKKLPLNFGSNVDDTLQKIEACREWWDELQWEDENVKSKFAPYFIPEYKNENKNENCCVM